MAIAPWGRGLTICLPFGIPQTCNCADERNLPRVMGDSFIHLRDIDIIVEEDRPMLTLAPPTITEVEQKIGEYCASLVQDGDTIQLGIGGIPMPL